MLTDRTTYQDVRITDVSERIALDLCDKGWCVTDDFLPASLISQLADESEKIFRYGGFRQAGIGRRNNFRLLPQVRTDWIKWLDPFQCTTAQSEYLDALDSLRLTINRIMYLGIFEFEGHLATYPPGGYYRKHLDQFKGSEQRLVTCILYLNQDWQENDGGQLLLYTDPTDETRYEEILPISGRLVTFLSGRFLHAVQPSRVKRLSITGWFKTRIPVS